MCKITVKINQGRYDNGKSLLTLRANALERHRLDVVDAIDQRLRYVSPNDYQRLVGPLTRRSRDRRFTCYCNYPKSLLAISQDIMSGQVPADALTCDACWQRDLEKTWGHYG